MYRALRVVLPLVCIAVFSAVFYFNWLAGLDRYLHDRLLTATRPAAGNIIIVGIDERSINEIGTWPWPRYFMAEAITQLSNNGAAAIGVTVRYEGDGSVPEYDERLVQAAQATDRLVMGGVGIFNPNQAPNTRIEIIDYILPFDALARETSNGFLNLIPHASDGVMRHALTAMRFGDITVYSFPLEVYHTYRRSMGYTAVRAPQLDAQGQFPIRYAGGPNHFRAVSLWGVINEEYPTALFRDAIVLIGAYTEGIGEMHFTTPMERRAATHGVEVYANIIQNFLEGVFLSDAPAWVNGVIFAAVSLLSLLIYAFLRPSFALVGVVLLLIALPVGAYFAYTQGHMIVQISTGVVYLPVSYALYVLAAALHAQHDRKHIHSLFGRFVAPEVVREIVSGGVEIQLGGVVKEVSALFVDIRGFTSFSESNPPKQVVEMVNKYLGLTCSAIQSNLGTIDKFIGDATMGLFNAPGDVPDHALRAVKAAWTMKQGSEELRRDMMQEYGVNFHFGIGINTGNAVVGNMGSDFRMDYTAIGDAINTAARLESNAIEGQIVISDATYQQVKQHVDVIDLGVLQLRNKKVGVQAYSVIGVNL
ncbi:MAG: adenylate/guanylate cyclase domain-containing protein [Defluviitaleaceae bacterium]|nr:adenylate/guanylate cyclase domain-containing protein [Defluviitaleaceae bacterium]MCL2275343.1 adenylate/guanylate cyclase domain-containing protein [Defluviitaleaceae bacterium]